MLCSLSHFYSARGVVPFTSVWVTLPPLTLPRSSLQVCPGGDSRYQVDSINHYNELAQICVLEEMMGLLEGSWDLWWSALVKGSISLGGGREYCSPRLLPISLLPAHQEVSNSALPHSSTMVFQSPPRLSVTRPSHHH